MPIVFIDRETALKRNPCLAHAVLRFQADCHPGRDGLFQAGEEIWPIDGDAPVTLTADAAEAINREHIDDWMRTTDRLAIPKGIDKPVSFNIAAAPAGNLQGVLSRNGKAWVRLCAAMDWGDTIILPVFAHGLLQQDNPHPPMRRAHQRLLGLGLTPDYAGAMLVSGDEAAPLIADLFRVARYNASAPYIFLTGERAKTVSALCDSVNFHFDGYDEAETRRFVRNLKKAGLYRFRDGICREHFSEIGAIGGRRLDLEL